jgi:hypothetical protein
VLYVRCCGYHACFLEHQWSSLASTGSMQAPVCVLLLANLLDSCYSKLSVSLTLRKLDFRFRSSARKNRRDTHSSQRVVVLASCAPAAGIGSSTCGRLVTDVLLYAHSSYKAAL